MLYAVAVNYKTSELIGRWAASIRRCAQIDSQLYVVDNFSSEQEGLQTINACSSASIKLIKSLNIGYGAALNLGIAEALKDGMKAGDWLLLSNMDVEFQCLDLEGSERVVSVCQCLQSGQDMNPFLTALSKKALPIHVLSARLESPLLKKCALAAQSLLKLLPSVPVAVHGSAFIFRWDQGYSIPIFNDKSFLYCEELEFMSWAERNFCELRASKTSFTHIGEVVSAHAVFETSRFHNWCKSMMNWSDRWR